MPWPQPIYRQLGRSVHRHPSRHAHFAPPSPGPAATAFPTVPYPGPTSRVPQANPIFYPPDDIYNPPTRTTLPHWEPPARQPAPPQPQPQAVPVWFHTPTQAQAQPSAAQFLTSINTQAQALHAQAQALHAQAQALYPTRPQQAPAPAPVQGVGFAQIPGLAQVSGFAQVQVPMQVQVPGFAQAQVQAGQVPVPVQTPAAAQAPGLAPVQAPVPAQAAAPLSTPARTPGQAPARALPQTPAQAPGQALGLAQAPGFAQVPGFAQASGFAQVPIGFQVPTLSVQIPIVQLPTPYTGLLGDIPLPNGPALLPQLAADSPSLIDWLIYDDPPHDFSEYPPGVVEPRAILPDVTKIEITYDHPPDLSLQRNFFQAITVHASYPHAHISWRDLLRAVVNHFSEPVKAGYIRQVPDRDRAALRDNLMRRLATTPNPSALAPIRADTLRGQVKFGGFRITEMNGPSCTLHMSLRFL